MPQQQQFSGNPFLLGDSERGSYDYSGMTPDEAQTQRNISQRRQMAKLMMYQGQQQAGKKGGMVGNIYVKASPMEGLAGVGQVGLGGLADYFLNKESTEETKKQAKDRKARIDEYIAATTDTPAVPSVPASMGSLATQTPSNLESIFDKSSLDENAPSIRGKVANALFHQGQTDSPKPLVDMSASQPRFTMDELTAGVQGQGPGDDTGVVRMMGEFGAMRDPKFAPTDYQPAVETAAVPPSLGSPGTPGVTRSQGEIQRAGLKAFAYGDPRLDKLVGHVTDQRNQQEQNKLMREERISRDKQSDIYKNLLQDKVIKGQRDVADVAAGASLQRTDLGKIESINELLEGMDPASPDAKALIALRTKLSTHTPGTTVNVDTRTEGAYGKAFAGDIATNDAKFRDAAVGAPSLAERANRVSELLHSDTVFTGTAAEFKLQFVKAAKALGLTNSDSAAATEALVQELAGNTLDSIKSSGLGTGQGFTDKDLKFLEGAKSGRIVFEKETIQRLSDLSYKAATKSRSQWDTRKKTIPRSALAGTGLDQEQLPEMPARYTVPTNPAAAGGKTVVKTGKDKAGKDVIMYSDGTITHAD